MNSGEYEYRGGYYWRGGIAYTRTRYAYPQTYSWYNGYLYPNAIEYYYTYTVVPDIYPKSSADRISQLLDIAKQRDKYELEIRKQAAENAAVMQMAQQLGLQFGPISGYGQFVSYGGGIPVQAAAAVGSYGASGNTLYGVSSYQAVAQGYGQMDINQLYQSGFRALQNAQDYTKQAHSEMNASVQLAGDQAARIAEIQARGIAAAQVYRATEPQASAKVTVNGVVGAIGAEPVLPPMQAVGLLSDADFTAKVLTPNCLGCHSGAADAKSKLDLTGYLKFSVEQKRPIWERLFSSDPQRRMPKDHPPLEPGDARQFIR